MEKNLRWQNQENQNQKDTNGLVLKVSNVLGLEENFKDIRYIVL